MKGHWRKAIAFVIRIVKGRGDLGERYKNGGKSQHEKD